MYIAVVEILRKCSLEKAHIYLVNLSVTNMICYEPSWKPQRLWKQAPGSVMLNSKSILFEVLGIQVLVKDIQ